MDSCDGFGRSLKNSAFYMEESAQLSYKIL